MVVLIYYWIDEKQQERMLRHGPESLISFTSTPEPRIICSTCSVVPSDKTLLQCQYQTFVLLLRISLISTSDVVFSDPLAEPSPDFTPLQIPSIARPFRSRCNLHGAREDLSNLERLQLDSPIEITRRASRLQDLLPIRCLRDEFMVCSVISLQGID